MVYISLFLLHISRHKVPSLVDVQVLWNPAAGQAELLLPIPHLVNVVCHEEILHIEPCDQPAKAEEEPLPVQDPLHHGLAAPVAAERKVFQDIEYCTIQRRNAKLHLLLRAGGLWAELNPQASVRTDLRLQVEPSPCGPLLPLHPMTVKVLQEDQQDREAQKAHQDKKDGRFALPLHSCYLYIFQHRGFIAASECPPSSCPLLPLR